LINLKKKKTNESKSQQWKTDQPAKMSIANNKNHSKYHPTSGASEKKPTITRKPIVLPKVEAKKIAFSFLIAVVFFRATKRVFDEYKKS
jgi:hypothetical protein